MRKPGVPQPLRVHSDVVQRLEPGEAVRVEGRPGVWLVVRDTGGTFAIIRRGQEHTSAPREHVTQTKRKKAPA